MGNSTTKIDERFLERMMEVVVLYQKKYGRSPTQRELVKSLSSNLRRVNYYVHKLKERNKIELTEENEIAVPKNIDSSDYEHIPLIGHIACGLPSLAIEDYESMYKIPRRFCGVGEFFMLIAKGDSMIGANIIEGDYLVIKRQEVADNGDIVVACKISDYSNDSEATLKRYKYNNGHPILHAENPSYEDINAKEYRIVGKLKSIIRNIEEIAPQ